MLKISLDGIIKRMKCDSGDKIERSDRMQYVLVFALKLVNGKKKLKVFLSFGVVLLLHIRRWGDC